MLPLCVKAMTVRCITSLLKESGFTCTLDVVYHLTGVSNLPSQEIIIFTMNITHTSL